MWHTLAAPSPTGRVYKYLQNLPVEKWWPDLQNKNTVEHSTHSRHSARCFVCVFLLCLAITYRHRETKTQRSWELVGDGAGIWVCLAPTWETTHAILTRRISASICLSSAVTNSNHSILRTVLFGTVSYLGNLSQVILTRPPPAFTQAASHLILLHYMPQKLRHLDVFLIYWEYGTSSSYKYIVFLLLDNLTNKFSKCDPI